MAGNIGTGKTTTSKTLFGPNTFYVSEDSLCLLLNMNHYGKELWDLEHWSMYNKCKLDITRNALQLGYNIIVDGAHINKQSRKPILYIAKQHNTKVEVFWHKDPNGLQHRLQDNRGEPDDLWKEVWTRFEKQQEDPSLDEGISIIHIKETI